MKRHVHRYEMVRPGDAWLCTQGEHNRAEANGSRGFPAIIMCNNIGDGGCAQGWCVDCIPLAGAPEMEGGRL